jgi:hypothetical protein
MRRSSGFFGGYSSVTLGTAVAVMSFVATLQLSAAPPFTSEPMIDRTNKSDRLPSTPGRTGANHTPRSEPALPEGCHSSSEGLHHPFATEVPGRCVA